MNNDHTARILDGTCPKEVKDRAGRRVFGLQRIELRNDDDQHVSRAFNFKTERHYRR